MNRSIRRTRATDFLLTAALAMPLISTGCNVEPETLEALAEAAGQMQGDEADAGGPLSSMGMLNQVSFGDDADGDSATTGFQPPYPQRVDPFTFPDGEGLAQDDNPVTSVKEVEVLGFSDVNEPRVFLRTRSGVRSIRVGQKVDGIEVLQINQPAVELKIGNLVWSATMFDHNRKQ